MCLSAYFSSFPLYLRSDNWLPAARKRQRAGGEIQENELRKCGKTQKRKVRRTGLLGRKHVRDCWQLFSTRFGDTLMLTCPRRVGLHVSSCLQCGCLPLGLRNLGHCSTLFLSL